VTPPGVEPRDAAERLVARVIADVLGTAVLPGVTDDLAGALHGAALAEAGARLAGETGTPVDAAVVFAVPTIEAAAEHLRVAEDAEAGQFIRPISPGGPNPPVLLAHPAGGTTGVYKALASLLGGGRPVFGLERLDGPVHDRAARYARAILERFGGGGWVIGGWSFGGVLGYETARQLREAGHRAELVVLLDAALPLPVSQGGEGEALARRFAAFAGYLERTYGLTVGVAAEELLGLDEDAQLGLLMERMAQAGLADVLSPAILRHQIQSHEDTRALEQYDPAGYAGAAVLYRTEQETPWAVHDPRYQITSETRGWGPFCADLTVVGVAAHHLNLLDPPAVHAVAAHLRTLISAPDSHSQGGHP
jgi:phthiocerol/phenolphthiocerol synthesis type-I polyketide synthase D